VTTQMAIELDAAERDRFDRWLKTAAVAVNPDQPRAVTPGRAVSAMLRATIANETVAHIVLDQLRQDHKSGR
jgi:hypothetical protein